MIRVLMMDSRTREVIFRGSFDKVEMAKRGQTHPLYPERSFQEVGPETNADTAGEYVFLLTKEYDGDETEDSPPALEEAAEDYGDAGLSNQDFLYPFSRR